MVESVGKKLNQARIKRGLSVDEAAHATKLRPDKIVALEHDDYSRFASNVYAKGFLQLYGRFLNVDVSEFANNLITSNPISVQDYQYLTSGANAPRPEEKSSSSSYFRREERRAPSFVPFLVFVAMVALAAFGFQAYINWQRISGDNRKAPGAHPESKSAPEAAAASPGPVNPTRITPPAGAPIADVAPAASLPVEVIPDRDFVSVTQAPPAPEPAAPLNEILVQPLKKTWITVRRDHQDSAPVFEDYLYPDAPALKLKGRRFFIEARDPGAIQIRKNGTPIAYQAPGVDIH